MTNNRFLILMAAAAFSLAGCNATQPSTDTSTGTSTDTTPSDTSEATDGDSGVSGDSAIDLFAIPDIAVPALGDVPVTEIESEQYTGTVSWEPDHNPFQSDTAYTATITLSPKAGYTLSGVAADTFTIDSATVTHEAESDTITAEFASTLSTVTLPSLDDVAAPMTGEEAVSSIDTEQYTGTVEWNPTLTEDNLFESNTAYTATITLSPKAGYTLSGVSANTFTLTDATSVTHEANAGVITAEFASTLTSVSLFSLDDDDVTTPFTGEEDVSSIDTEQYTGTVEWNPTLTEDNLFESNTAYTATITLSPKADYTLSGVDANTFTISGADTVTHDANAGVITAEFSATVPLSTVGLALPNELTATQVGATPITSLDTSEYTAEVQWTPNHTTFRILTEYTADITVTPKRGYTLNGINANSFTLEDTTDVTHAADSGAISATFDATTLTFTRRDATGLDGQTSTVYDLFVLDNTVYTANQAGGVSISTDDGATFTNFDQGALDSGSATVNSVFVDSDGAIYAATVGGLSISTDGGTSFTNYLGSDDVREVFVDGNTIYAAINGGVSVSEDGGANFTDLTYTDAWLSKDVRSVWVDGSTIYAGSDNNLGVASTTQPQFSPINGPKTFLAGIKDITKHDSTMYFISSSSLYTLEDGGSVTDQASPGGTLRRLFVAEDGVIYIASTSGLHVSADGGKNFTEYTFGTNQGFAVFVENNTVYVAVTGPELWVADY